MTIPQTDLISNEQTLLNQAIRTEDFTRQQASESLDLDKKIITICTISSLLSVFFGGKIGTNILHNILLISGLALLVSAVLLALCDIFRKHEVEYISVAKIRCAASKSSHEKVLSSLVNDFCKAAENNDNLQKKRNILVRISYIIYMFGFILSILSYFI